MAKDPVCGRELDFSMHTDQVQYGGWMVYFCSQECKSEFLRDPEAYHLEHTESATAAKRRFEI